MPLKRVRIESFRCLTKAELQLHPRKNYVFGPNGAGKTSLLEAIYLLGRGRSFRTRHSRRLIQHGQQRFSVYGELDLSGNVHRLGVGCGPEGLGLRLDGEPASGLAALAELLPIHVIEPNIHDLVEGGPKVRRRFLDWGVFHVKQGYLETWRRYRRILGQRNAALKVRSGVSGWNVSLIEAGAALDLARGRYVGELNLALRGLGESLLGYPLEVRYLRGWTEGMAFPEALEASADRDRTQGATQVGPHRADLRVSLDARGVREEVSRGQQKLVAAGLIIAQIRVFAGDRGYGGVLLVDDPAAELDKGAREGLMSVLDELPAQQVITSLSERALPAAPGYPVFHVEPGGALSMLQ